VNTTATILKTRLEMSASDAQLCESALRFIQQVDPDKYDDLTASYDWTVSTANWSYPALGVTLTNISSTLLLMSTIRLYAKNYNLPLDKVVAMVLVHEHAHLPAQHDERPAILATAEFVKHWPPSHERDVALSAVLKDLGAVNAQGKWQYAA
jgi:hypothetical protein